MFHRLIRLFLVALGLSTVADAHAADGVIHGQVIDHDARAVAGATVTVVSTGASVTTSAGGHYTMSAPAGTHTIRVVREGHLSGFVTIDVAADRGTAAPDVRLTQLVDTPLATLPPGFRRFPNGGVQDDGTAIRLYKLEAVRTYELARSHGTPATPPAPFLTIGKSQPSMLRITDLEQQRLPHPLPLGWTPLGAFDIQLVAGASSALTLSLGDLPAEATQVHLVRFEPPRNWVMVAPALSVGGGVLQTTLPGPGTYGVIVADVDGPVAPAAGEILPGVPPVEMPTAVIGEILPAHNVMLVGSIPAAVTARPPVPLPSGSTVELQRAEQITLPNGDLLRTESRYQTIRIFRPIGGDGHLLSASDARLSVGAEFRADSTARGRMTLNIWSARPSQRGAVGGLDPVVIESETDGLSATLSVPGGSLPTNTAITVEAVALPNSAPLAGATAVAEVAVDFGGQVLSAPAELSVRSTVPDGASFVLARVESVGGTPQLVVAGLAHVQSGFVVTTTPEGLPGIRTGGRYLLFRLNAPVGLAAVALTPPSASAIVRVVSTPSLFAGALREDGRYVVVSPLGSVRIGALVPDTTFTGEAPATVSSGGAADVTITLVGETIETTVTPASGAVVPPASLTFTIQAPSPIDADSASPGNIQLVKVATGTSVPLRFVFGARSMSIIPTGPPDAPSQAPIEWAADYRLTVSGLRARNGSPLSVPTTNVRTTARPDDTIDPSKLSLSFPDENGEVTASAAPGSFAPGSIVMMTNYGNGVVLSAMVDNQGALNTKLTAQIGDRIRVDITAPNGAEASFERAQYYDGATGRTGLGTAGGVVSGPSGTEMRVPEGALPKAVTVKVETYAVPTDSKPEFGQMASGLRVTLSEPVTFNKEVDLAFPVPSLPPGVAPRDAFYYVYREIRAPSGKRFFQVVDEAKVEGEGADQKIVTASPPFSGYSDSIGSIGFSGSGAATLGPVATNHFFLMYTHDAAAVGKPLPLAVTGKVFQEVWKEGSYTPTNVGVPNVPVFVLDASDNRLIDQIDNPTVALTQRDGSFVMWDTRNVGGHYKVVAQFPDGTVRSSTLYSVDPQTFGSPRLRFYNAILTANITAPPPEAVTPAAPLRIRVFHEQNGKRKDIPGMVAQGTALLLGVNAPQELESLTVRSGPRMDSLNPVADPLAGQDPSGADWVAPYTPSTPGTYVVAARIQPPVGPPVTETVSFLVIAPGGDNTLPLADEAPRVIEPIVPKRDAKLVPVSTLPQLTFSEPVTQVSGKVSLVQILADGTEGNAVPVALSAVTITPEGPVPVADLTDPAAVVTSLTLLPRRLLDFEARYRIKIAAGIVDTDAPPKALPEFISEFTTFKSSVLGETELFPSAGIAVLEDRAYLVETSPTRRQVRAFDISDPVQPKDATLPPFVTVYGRPVDVAGEVSPDGRTLVVATGPTNRALPANLHLIDASADLLHWRGAVSLTHDAVEGYITRVVVKDGIAYAAVARRGVQILELSKISELFPAPGTAEHAAAVQSLATPGQGWGTEHATTIAIPADGYPARGATDAVLDIEVCEYGTERLVIGAAKHFDNGVATPYVAVDPITRTYVKKPLDAGTWKLLSADAIGLGQVEAQEMAVLAGTGRHTGCEANCKMLVVANASTPRAPVALGYVALPRDIAIHDVLLKDDLALVGLADRVLVVGLTNPAQPTIIATLHGIAGRLALDSNGILFGSAKLGFGLTGESVDKYAGVKTAALDRLTYIKSAEAVIVDINAVSVETQRIKYRTLFPREDIETSEIEIVKDGTVVQRFDANVDDDGQGEIDLPVGLQHGPLSARLSINRDIPAAERPFAAPKQLRTASFDVQPEDADFGTVNEPLAVTAINEALIERLQRDTDPGTSLNLYWRVLGPSGQMTPAAEAPADGIYYSELFAGRAGTHQIELLKDENTVLARSGTIEVESGPAAKAALSGNAPANCSGTECHIPADGTSTFVVTLQQVRDEADNIVPDGTRVLWVLEGDGGEIPAPFAMTIGGSTWVTYRAGIEPGPIKLIALVDEARFEMTIVQAPLEVTLTEQWPTLDLTVSSSAGPPADNTPVGWGWSRGTLLHERELRGGRAQATWLGSSRPGDESQRRVYLFATVGRKRTDPLIHEFAAGPGGGTTARFRDDSVTHTPSGNAGLVPSETVAEITGQPGEQVNLILGTNRYPIQQPVVTFPLDVIREGVTGDLYAGLNAAVDPSVSVDTADPNFQPGAFHFTGAGGLSVADAPALNLRDNFGINAWLRLDAPSAGQKVLEKAGAYGIQVVEHNAQLHLEFFVMSGGTRKRVLSEQALAAATWYHVSAHIRAGTLQLGLSVDPNDVIRIGDAAGVIDTSTAPLVIGETFYGNIDEVAFYDFTRAPLLQFADGTTQKTVTLDPAGEALVTVQAGLFQPSGPVPTEAWDLGDLQARTSRGRLGMRTIDPERENQRALAELRAMLVIDERACMEMLLVGEGPSNSLVCDILGGLNPVVGGYQSVRDMFTVSRNYAQGKSQKGDFLKGTLATMAMIPIVSPQARALVKAYKAAGAALEGTQLESTIARSAAEAGAAALGEGTHVPLQGLLDVLEAGGPEAAALRRLWGCADGTCGQLAFRELRNWWTLDQIGTRWGSHRELVMLLDRLARRGHSVEALEKFVRALARANLPRQLNENAMEGMAIFARRVPGPHRLANVWTQIQNAPNLTTDAERLRVMEQSFDLIRQGEQFNLPDWDHFVKLGAGTGVPTRGPGQFTAEGFFHHLQGLIEHAIKRGPRVIEALDKKVDDYPGRIDALLREAAGRVQEEYKVIRIKAPGTPPSRMVSGEFKAGLDANIKHAILRATAAGGGRPNPVTMADELSRIRYRIRGAGASFPRLEAYLRKRIANNLGTTFKGLESKVQLVFEAEKSVPF